MMATIYIENGKAVDENGTEGDARLGFGEQVQFKSRDRAYRIQFQGGKTPFRNRPPMIRIPATDQGVYQTSVVAEEVYVYDILPARDDESNSKSPDRGTARIRITDSSRETTDSGFNLGTSGGRIIDPDHEVTVSECDIEPKRLEVRRGDVILFEGPAGGEIEFSNPSPFKKCGKRIPLPKACVIKLNETVKDHDYSVVGCSGIGSARIRIKDAK